MKSFIRLVLFVALLLALTSHSGHTQQQNANKGGPLQGEYVEGELLIKFGNESASVRAAVDRVGRQIGVEQLHDFPEIGWQQVRLPSGLTVAEGLERYRNVSGVELVQPNFVYHTLAIPNDPQYGSLYGLTKIQAPLAWDTTTGSSNVVVADIDLGVDYNHEDLQANMWRNPGEAGLDSSGHDKATNGIDDDSDGYIDDVYGIDTINHDSDPMDDDSISRSHGTHTSGTIGAVGNNGKGVSGVNWSVRIMAIKSHDSSGNGTSASVIEAFHYAAMMRRRGIAVRATNSSWGGAPEAPAFDQALKDAIDDAGSAGIVNVCAAGNSNSNNDAAPFYPASYDSPSIIAVAASDQNDDRAGFSSYGASSVDLAAPGVGILSTQRGDRYGFLSGTSMATPHVSGAVALLCSYNPDLSVAQIKTILIASVDVLPQWSGLTVSGGRLNVARALQMAAPSPSPSPSPPVNIDDPSDFVRRHYLDFLYRDPDPDGQAYWTSRITACGTDATCILGRRTDVSAAFIIETEFQETGYFLYRMYKASYGRMPVFAEYDADRVLIVGGPNLESSKQAFADGWVQRSAFLQVYPVTMSADDFVNRLFDTAQLFPYVNERQQESVALQSNAKTRAQVLRDVIEFPEFINREYNPSFVLMEYFGYLRRNADSAGYTFWLNVLNNAQPGNYRGMVCSFITSSEYQLRFSTTVTHSNAECGP